MRSSFRYEIKGLVQGVGFRPFVYTLADKFKLVGEIYNDDEGVKLNFSGEEASFLAFEKELYAKLPALARIDELHKFKIKNVTLSGDLFYNKAVSNLIKKHLNPNIKTNFDPGFGVEIKL